MTVRLAQIGCGLMAHRRAELLPENCQIVSCYDLNPEASAHYAKQLGIEPSESYQEALAPCHRIAGVIVSVYNSALTAFAQIAIEHFKIKHVFLEKPGGTNPSQMIALQALAEREKAHVTVGFTLRYHDGVREMFRMLHHGTIGAPLFIRARYGHGARPNYDRQWRANPALSGGGQLIDQGVHLIDLATQILGTMRLRHASLDANRWRMSDDSAFLVLEQSSAAFSPATAFLHTSCTEARNIFSFEVCGALGSIEVNGLGGSYGREHLIHHNVGAQPRVPDTIRYSFESFALAAELGAFANSITNPMVPSPSLKEAIAVMKIVEKAYSQII